MNSQDRRIRRWWAGLVLVACAGLVPATEAAGATFAIEGLFQDATSFSGELEIDLGTEEVSDWRIQTQDGELFEFEWTPANSEAIYIEAIDDKRLLYFWTPPPSFSNKLFGREFEIFLTDRIEGSAVLAMHPFQSEEREPCHATFCLNRPAARSVASLELTQVPEPRLGHLLLGGMAAIALRVRAQPGSDESS